MDNVNHDLKILIISHTCFSSNNSMGSTLASYFSGYPSENIAQLYIKQMQPNLNVCDNYFCVTDNDLLKKAKNPFYKNVGRIVERKDVDESIKSIAEHDKKGGKNRHFNLLLRNFIWSLKAWDNKRFKNWVEAFSPDIIVLQPGDFSYLFKIALILSKRYDMPIIVHQSESYYLKPYFYKNLFYRIYRSEYKKAYERLMKKTSAVVYLCDALKIDYDIFFQVPSFSIMKTTNVLPSPSEERKKEDFRFIYAGNIGEKVGRAGPLSEIGKALKKLGYYLDVYTASKGDHLKDLTEDNGIMMHGAIGYDELQNRIKQSDFIIHTESFDEEKVIDLKYAFSTKIADMLASGRCPIVYGTTRIASIKYFKDTGTAVVIETKDDLESKISEIINNTELRKKIIKKAIYQAKEYHSPKKNPERFFEIFDRVYKEYHGNVDK